jgi:hypothetical protein
MAKGCTHEGWMDGRIDGWMDDKWLGNNFLLGFFSSHANHGVVPTLTMVWLARRLSFLKKIYYLPTNNP